MTDGSRSAQLSHVEDGGEIPELSVPGVDVEPKSHLAA
jgi:hypothetical protein